MRGEDSYAILGLRPGAGRAEIDQAYRRLIKRYHPDQAGGDVGRAADLNRAYSDLRDRTRTRQPSAAPGPRPGPQPVPRQLPPQRTPSSKWGTVGLVLAIFGLAGLVGGAVFLDGERRLPTLSDARAALTESRPERSQELQRLAPMSMDSPLATGMIDLAVNDAMRLHADDDAQSAAEFSRECMARLTASPSVAMFDSCAAFDEAISIVAAGNPAFESGAFNASTVTARQIGAARLLSADYLDSESRLQQVRSRVQMQLLPRIPDSAANAQILIGTPAP